MSLKIHVNKILNGFGFEIKRKSKGLYPVEFSERDIEIINYIKKNRLTMVSVERLIATVKACKYSIVSGIKGDFVECGVWRGGCSLAAKLTFEAYKSNKKVYLYDTFLGMTEPNIKDEHIRDKNYAFDQYSKSSRSNHNDWCYSSLDEVKNNFIKANVDLKGVKFVAGDVRKTLNNKNHLPKNICALRLDTDFYDSTKKEMEVLYPLLEKGGVLLIDDYGTWKGSKLAIDEYFENNSIIKPLLNYTDYSGRSGIKSF